MMRSKALSLILTIACVVSLEAQNCDKAPTGLIPTTEMGSARYRGFPGGLYPNASNAVPVAHASLGLALSKSLTPLDKNGKPSARGKIVLLSIGMSNATQEFSHFARLVNIDVQRNDNLVLVDGAVSGHDASKVADPKHNYWTIVQQRLTAAGVTAAQIQVFWLKEAMANPTTVFPTHAQKLRDYLIQIAQNLRAKFPNGKLCYVSSRIHAGYATSTLNPEPYAYESGFAVKWLIERQILGDKALNPDPKVGTVMAPWLAWGPYLWADGLKARKDGLRWWCDEFASDGTHPSDSGRWKVADLLLQHFHSATSTQAWYFGGTQQAKSSVILYGAACRGKTGLPITQVFGVPTVGNDKFAIGESNIPPSSIAVALVSNRRHFGMLGEKCDLMVDLGSVVFFHPIVTTIQGTVHMLIPVPNNSSMLGAELYCQWLNLDPGGTYVPLGGVSLSRGIHAQIGR